MTCVESRSLILLRSEELTKGEAEELHRHVKTCADCSAYMQEAKGMSYAVEKLRSFQPIL